MPSLSARKLYKTESLVRILMRAGQLAHLREAEIRYALDVPYAPNRALRENHPVESLYYDDENHVYSIVPDALWKAHVSCGFPRLYDGMHVLEYFLCNVGIVCPLCGRIETSRYRINTMPSFIAAHVSASSLVVHTGKRQPIGLIRTHATSCENCANQVNNWLCRTMGHMSYYDGSDDIALAAIHWLAGNSLFRRRVKENKRTWDDLRFDPRNPQWVDRTEGKAA